MASLRYVFHRQKQTDGQPSGSGTGESVFPQYLTLTQFSFRSWLAGRAPSPVVPSTSEHHPMPVGKVEEGGTPQRCLHVDSQASPKAMQCDELEKKTQTSHAEDPKKTKYLRMRMRSDPKKRPSAHSAGLP
ncbi:hypothetical protein TWF594_004180 [Orbilia oligospora]|nr:hypothetical protein TWF594_004180 [Orbilia oligospora]